MDPQVRLKLTPDVHARIARTVGVAPAALRSIGGFESFVYEATPRGNPTIIKATWSARRSVQELAAEQHFLRYLSDGGAPVCTAVPLHGDAWIGTVAFEDGEFLITAFEKAPGAKLADHEWNDTVLERWGELTGRLHRLATDYPGPPPPQRRPTWEAEYAQIERMLEDHPQVQTQFQQILRKVSELPRERGTFGPMHTDLHAGNVFWLAERPRAFDFDDMLDFWFVSDLAIILFYGLRRPPWSPDDRQADFERMRAALLRGYARQHELPAWCDEALPLFLDLREHLLWAVLTHSVPESERSAAMQADVVGATERILGGRPALDLAW